MVQPYHWCRVKVLHMFSFVHIAVQRTSYLFLGCEQIVNEQTIVLTNKPYLLDSLLNEIFMIMSVKILEIF